jgi:hypothetical protein
MKLEEYIKDMHLDVKEVKREVNRVIGILRGMTGRTLDAHRQWVLLDFRRDEIINGVLNPTYNFLSDVLDYMEALRDLLDEIAREGR